MTFIETLIALITTLSIAWAFKKYIEPKLDKLHKRTKKHKHIIRKRIVERFKKIINQR